MLQFLSTAVERRFPVVTAIYLPVLDWLCDLLKLKRQFSIEWDKEWSKQLPESRNQNPLCQAYKQGKEHVRKDLHIDFRRHRRPNEFLAYFAYKFTGVYQYLSTQEYLLLAEQIQSEPERIQILCLLALPAI